MARRKNNPAIALRMAELFPDSVDAAALEPQPSTLRFRVSWAAGTVVVLLALLFGAVVLWLGSGSVGAAESVAGASDLPAVTAAPMVPEATSGARETGTSVPERTKLIVHVVGAVVRPGIVSIPPGSRLFEALEAVGGALPEAALAGVNLAAELKDGAQILVPTQAELAAAQVPVQLGEASPALPAGPLNLNEATVEQLITLPRIGPKTAERVVKWRADNGRFRTVDDLAAVPGIGMKTLESLRSLLVV